MITIETRLFCKALRFASACAARKDIRFYLLGVRVEAVGDTLTLCGTDGARIAVCALRIDSDSMTDLSLTIGNDDVKRILSAFGKDKGQIVLRSEHQADQVPTLIVEAGGVILRIKALGGVFPDYRRVIPPTDRKQGGMPSIDALLMAEACTALEPLAGKLKNTCPLQFDSTGGPADFVVVRPATIDDTRVAELLVVIAPIRV